MGKIQPSKQSIGLHQTCNLTWKYGINGIYNKVFKGSKINLLIFSSFLFGNLICNINLRGPYLGQLQEKNSIFTQHSHFSNENQNVLHFILYKTNQLDWLYFSWPGYSLHSRETLALRSNMKNFCFTNIANLNAYSGMEHNNGIWIWTAKLSWIMISFYSNP